MKERAQIQFEPEQAATLRERAAAEGRSIAAIVRDAVTAYLDRPEREGAVERLLAAGGRFRSGAGDAAERHDDYLAEDYR